ncbi:uncharacterized protein BO72DRAFT_507920 [Aspergillus fijiensis CBS 313.89]|uniref:Uncharacterized protein n=1 Tax=Aspergillus fijiensis CBS 313.89 TaxID=1448319 RepID=A0A8G1VZZ3_9EURO|nr:uncharacterized protein BO72DRAFT_507920 [Aspergillus fijiensis CBS 313.89]RAK78063.1 hypothetical protein BO72DRAFT_507920 [Aspergillus fijiensis CBS 313.89]
MSHGSSHYAFQPVTIMHGLRPTDAHAGEEEVRPILLRPTLGNDPSLVYGRSPPAAALFNNLLQADWAYFGLPRESTTFPFHAGIEAAEQLYRTLQFRSSLLGLLTVHDESLTGGALRGLHGSEAQRLALQKLAGTAATDYNIRATDLLHKWDEKLTMTKTELWQTLVEICGGREVLLMNPDPSEELRPWLGLVIEACCRLGGAVDLIYSLVGAPWSLERTRRVAQLQHLIRSAFVAHDGLHAGGDDSDVSMADAD